MTLGASDKAAIARHIDRVASGPIDRGDEAILRGMNAAADILVAAAAEPSVVAKLRIDPVGGLLQIADELRDARAPS